MIFNDEVKLGDIILLMDIFFVGFVFIKRILLIFICMKIYFYKYEVFFISLEFNFSVCVKYDVLCVVYI